LFLISALAQFRMLRVRAVVLLELDQVGDLELALEGCHVADVGAPEGVDALVVVADREDRGAAAGQQLEPFVLQRVGVLELVDQDVREAPLVVLAQQLAALQQLVAAQQQFGKVDHALALALVVVGRVQLDAAPGIVVVGLDLARALAFFLGVLMKCCDVARRELLVVDIERLQQALDGGELVLRIEDLEGVGQSGIAVMRTQHAVAQAMEGADPQAARDDGQHRRQPGEHFAGCLVGERDRKHTLRTHLAGLDQPGHAGREHTGLAAASTREDQRMLGRQGDRRELAFVEIGEEIGHGGR
jgi:hypothetical protein